jgi:hypothetical protein
MSEPFSAVAQVTIGRGALISYLDATPKSSRQWDDWSLIGDEWYDFSWETDLTRTLEAVDRRLKRSYREIISDFVETDEIMPGCERCSYDEASELFTFGTLMFSENVEDITLFFAVARGMADFMQGEEAGFAVMRDYFWGEPPWTVALDLAAGRSRFLDPQADAASFERHVGAAVAVFDDIKEGGGDLARVINQIDSLR